MIIAQSTHRRSKITGDGGLEVAEAEEVAGEQKMSIAWSEVLATHIIASAGYC